MPERIKTDEDMAVFLKRAGFDLTPEQIAEYREPYGYIVAMAARLRGERSYMAEPAHIFGYKEGDL